MTNEKFFTIVIKANISEEVTKKAEHLLEVTRRKIAKQTKKQEENHKTNLSLLKDLVAIMKQNNIENFDVSELRKITKTNLSPAKLSAICSEGVLNRILEYVQNYTPDGEWKHTYRYHII